MRHDLQPSWAHCCARHWQMLRAFEYAHRYELVEINSRYSYMGNWRVSVPVAHNKDDSKRYSRGSVTTDRTSRSEQPREIRNLVNRTRLALGSDPLTLPSRDQVRASEDKRRPLFALALCHLF